MLTWILQLFSDEKYEKDTWFSCFFAESFKIQIGTGRSSDLSPFQRLPAPDVPEQWFTVEKLFRNYSSGNCTGIICNQTHLFPF
jgi:hypothetical protein